MFQIGKYQSGFLALTLSTGCLNIGEWGCLEFEFLTEGPWQERKAANSCCVLYGRKAGSKLFCADRTMRREGGPGHIIGGRAPEGSYFSSLGQIFCDREQHT